mgnify:CR=1 FL=1
MEAIIVQFWYFKQTVWKDQREQFLLRIFFPLAETELFTKGFTMTATQSIKRPVHLWIVGILALAWNAMGAFDYLMTQTKNESYMEKFTPEQLEFFYGFPIWVESAWAIAVWGAVLGSILLLFRRKCSEGVFLVALVAMTLTAIHNYGLSNGLEVIGDSFSLIFTALIFVISVALYLYARAMRKNGVLS